MATVYPHSLWLHGFKARRHLASVSWNDKKHKTNSTIGHDRGFILRILFIHIADFSALLAPELLSYPEEKVDLANVLHGVHHAAASMVKMHFLGATQFLARIDNYRLRAIVRTVLSRQARRGSLEHSLGLHLYRPPVCSFLQVVDWLRGRRLWCGFTRAHSLLRGWFTVLAR